MGFPPEVGWNWSQFHLNGRGQATHPGPVVQTRHAARPRHLTPAVGAATSWCTMQPGVYSAL